MVKASACNAGDPGLIPGWGRSSGEGNGNPLQYSCLENSTDGGAWWATVHGVAKGRTRLSHFPERGKRYMGSLSIMFYRCEIEFHFKREWVHSCLQGVLLCSEWDLMPHAQVTSVHHSGVTRRAREGFQCNDGGAEFSSISSSERRGRASKAGRRAWTSRAPGSSFPKVPSGGHKISDHPTAKCEVMDRIITLHFLFSLWYPLPIIQ